MKSSYPGHLVRVLLSLAVVAMAGQWRPVSAQTASSGPPTPSPLTAPPSVTISTYPVNLCLPFERNDLVTGADPHNEENECSIAVNPTDSSNMVCTFMQFDKSMPQWTITIGVATSMDFGFTWSYDPADVNDSFAANGTGSLIENAFDPVVASAFKKDPVTPTGRFYLAYIEVSRSPIIPTSDARLVVRSSDDGGVTWSAAETVQEAIGMADEHYFIDKPWIAVDTFDDPTDTSRYAEQPVYVSYTAFNDDNQNFFFECAEDIGLRDTYPIMLEGSTDGGITWDMAPDPATGFEVTDVSDLTRRANQGSAISVGPSHRVYVAYTQGGCALDPVGPPLPVLDEIRVTQVKVDSSGNFIDPPNRTTVSAFGHFPVLHDYYDTGMFPDDTPVLVADSTTPPRDPMLPTTWTYFRVNNFPSIVATHYYPNFSGGPILAGAQDWVFVTWAHWTGNYAPRPATGQADIRFSRGTQVYDDLNWWVTPNTVNGDSTPPRDQFFPFVTHLPNTQIPPDETVRIFYYDRRRDQNNELINIYMAGSTNSGTTWTYEDIIRCTGINDAGFRADTFIGDYIGAAAYGNLSGNDAARVVWADSRNSNPPAVENEEVWTASRSFP
ncbi:MAG: sialidase family protein [Planctomycetota bacterium]|nr:sialidase family protein [Planctomycetota bacterium]